MNKYQEALDTITHLTFVESDSYELLKKLVEEKDEQESRKDKLVVGSEWECVVEHTSNQRVSMSVGDEVIIRLLDNGYVGYGDGFYKYGDNEEHFILCFKPKEV